MFSSFFFLQMLVPNKQLGLGRSHSWDTLGGNEGQWAESVYEQQARVAGRRSSLSYGEGGGWYEPSPGVRPPDLDLKRDPYSYQEAVYGQVYTDRHDPRGLRKSSVPDLNHYERASMAHRGSIPHQDYYAQDQAMSPRPPEGFYRSEHQPPPPHPLSRSGSHFGITPGNRAGWDQGQVGRAGPQVPVSPIHPPPPTAHELNRAYREAGAVTAAKMTSDSQQRRPSRDASPAHYNVEHPRYANEAPPLTSQPVYSDVNGRTSDPQQGATCLVVDPASQGMILRQETASPFSIQQQQQHIQQQQLQQQQLQQQHLQQQHLQQQQLQQQQQMQEQQLQQQIQQQQIQQLPQQQVQQEPLQQHLQQPLPPPPSMPASDSNLSVLAPLPTPPSMVHTAAVAPAAPAPVQPIQTSASPQVAQLPAPLPAPPTAPQTPLPVDPKKIVDPEFLALLRNEGLSESTITSVIQHGFDSTSMLAVMEENDVRAVAPNLGQARVLSRLLQNYKRPIEAPPAPSQPQTPMRGRSNSFSHRSDFPHHHYHPPHTPHTLNVDPGLMPPQTPGPMPSINPRMGEVMGRRPSSAPSQQLLEVSGGYPGQAPRTPGPYAGAIMPAHPRPLSAYSSGMTMPGMPMQGIQIMSQQMTGSMPAIAGSIHSMQGMPQQMPVSMPALPQPPQQVPKAYSTNYTVPMELMKRDRNLLPLSPMHSPHPSPQLMRKGSGSASDSALIPLVSAAQGQGQGSLVANPKLSRRTGPPVIVSTMASPDTSKAFFFFLIVFFIVYFLV